MNARRWATVLTAAVVASPLLAQLPATNAPNPADELVIQSWGTKDGLPRNTVNAIVQTRDGYLWIATREGLARFDGVRFTTYGLQDGLPSLEVQTLYEDRRGTLWIGTSGGGLGRWADGRIESVTFPQHLAASGTVTSLAEDAEGRLWIGTRAGLTIWEHGRFIRNENLAWLDHTGIRALLYDRSGGMWIATLAQGLWEYRNNRLQESLAPERILAYCLVEDTRSNLWASIGNGIVLCRQQNEWRSFTQNDGVPFAYVTCLALDQAGAVWAGSLDAGLYCFRNGRFVGLRKGDGLSADDIRALCPDQEGHLWVGTRTGGLNRLSRRRLVSYGVAQGLTNDYTRSVAETADGVLWVGTVGGGLCRSTPEGFRSFAPVHSLVESVLAAKDGSLWWGAARGLFQLQNRTVTRSYTNYPWVETALVTGLCEDGRGGLWVGTSEGRLVHYREGVFTEAPEPIAGGAITGLAQDAGATLWVGSLAGGLTRVDSDQKTGARLEAGVVKAIRTLYLDKEGVLWIGTAGGGLNRYYRGQVTVYTSRDGLGADTVVQIVEDDFGFLWLGTSRGVFRVRKADLQDFAAGKLAFLHPRAFGENEGMPAEECSSGFCPAGLKTRAGLVCFSTVKGLVFFDPRTQEADSPPPTVLLEEILVNGRLHKPETVEDDAPDSANPTLALGPGTRELEIHYTGISFGSPEKLRFRYRLEGLDQNWVEAGERRTAYYHFLPAGQYTFRVLACNADGVWSVTGPAVTLSVKPYFWNTPWFITVTGLLILAGVAGSIRLVERRRYRRRLAVIETRHAVERERLRISQDMHDEVGSILTQVSQLSDLGQGEPGSVPVVKTHFERIGAQARAAVQAMDEIVWATNPKNDNLPGFAEYICHYADELFETSPVRCWQEVPTTLPNAPLQADLRHNVFLALKESFNNVLRHSKASEVWLRLTLEGSDACLSVEDNGKGFDPAQLPSGGNGLENMRSRLTASGGRMELSSAVGAGTKLRFVFPLAPPRPSGPSHINVV